MRCDETGVPAMVQRLRYNYAWAWWEVVDFVGNHHEFEAEEVGLCQYQPTRLQELQAENRITKHLEATWHQ